MAPGRFGQDGTGRAAVVLHGFTGSPYDVQPLAESLAARGCAVELPLLRGHGDGVPGVMAATRDQWRDDVDAACARAAARAQTDTVGVVGLSMGALLALDAAYRLPSVQRVASLAAPLSLSAPARALARIAVTSDARWLRELVWPKFGGNDISTRERLPGPRGIPFAALWQLGELIDEVRAQLSRVTCPLLILHAHQDHTATPESALVIASNAGSASIELEIVERGFHVITRDVDAADVARRVTSFLVP